MPDQNRIVSPGTSARTVRTADGKMLLVPTGWVLVPPGDPALTRRVKAGGPSWTVQEKKGRRNFSRGVLARFSGRHATSAKIRTNNRTA